MNECKLKTEGKKVMKELLSIIVPCYNEGSVIEKTAKAIMNTCEGKTFDYEVIFVNDDSK